MIQLADLFIKKTLKEVGLVGLTTNPSIPEAVLGYQGIEKPCLMKQTSHKLFKMTINIKENIPKSKINKKKKESTSDNIRTS